MGGEASDWTERWVAMREEAGAWAEVDGVLEVVDWDPEEESDNPVGIPFFRSSFCSAVSVDVSPSRLHQSLNAVIFFLWSGAILKTE